MGSNREHAGVWISLQWPAAYLVDHIVLYDRFNLDDQIFERHHQVQRRVDYRSGADGQQWPAVTVSFTPRAITGFTFTINSDIVNHL